MGNQNDHLKEIEIETFNHLFQTNQEYDLDIYNHKDISIKKNIPTTSYQKAHFSRSDVLIEDAKLSSLHPFENQPRETNYTENMSIKSAGLTNSFQNDSYEEKNVQIETKGYVMFNLRKLMF